MNSSPSDIPKDFADGQKLFFEAFKHITTLATGITALLFTVGGSGFAVKATVVGWRAMLMWNCGICIFSCVATMMLLAYATMKSGKPSESIAWWGWIAVWVSAISFITLIGQLAYIAGRA